MVKVYVVVQFYSWFKVCFSLVLGMVTYDNEFETKENENKDKIEPRHTCREKPRRLGISKFPVCRDSLTDVNKNSRRHPSSSEMVGG